MRIATTSRRQSDDGIVALINIVFLLLIFFLIVGTITPRADVSVAYPETRESPVSPPPNGAVYVAADGLVFYRGHPVDLEDLASIVMADNAANSDRTLPVVVDRSLPASRLAPVLGALAGSGVQAIRLVTIRSRAAP